MALGLGHGRIRSENMPIAWFAHLLARRLQGSVVDDTGLRGKYDFMVSWALSQLGLKIEKKKMPAGVLALVESVVVGRLEKTPAKNQAPYSL